MSLCMPPSLPSAAALPLPGQTTEGWSAALDLRYERRGRRTVLAARSHHGPLRVQRPLYQEGESVCQTIIIHPPGGIVAGDRLALDVTAARAAHALLTTPGATKWYRSIGPEASQRVRLCVDPEAVLEWMPLESIVFDGACADQRLRVELAEGARYVGWEITCLGRTASGERFAHGRLRQRTEVYRGMRPVFVEYADVEGGSRILTSRAGLAGFTVNALMLAAGFDASRALIAALRAVPARKDELTGITNLPYVTIARYLGHSAHAARDWFTNLWRVLRPAMLEREALPPRIWAC